MRLMTTNEPSSRESADITASNAASSCTGPHERDVIEISDEMIEAGVYALREYCIGSPLEELVRSVYLAMVTEVVS